MLAVLATNPGETFINTTGLRLRRLLGYVWIVGEDPIVAWRFYPVESESWLLPVKESRRRTGGRKGH
jgi:hypothetical protein